MHSVTFNIQTFGCQMNVNDSRWLERELCSLGLVPAAPEDARVIILNTCAVREKPEQKTKSAIRRIAQLTGENPDVLVCVLGCVAQSLGTVLYENEPQVRLVAGVDGLVHVPAAIRALLKDRNAHLEYLDFSREYVERQGSGVVAGSAYVNIMQGCDNFCAYCIVPFTRGRQKSREARAIISECQQAVEAGAKEITLLGQNVNAYGKDCGGSFSALLGDVSAIAGLERLRFVAVHPRDMDFAIIRAFAEMSNVCPRLHLPLQSGSSRILAAMRRRYGRDEYIALVKELRRTRPDIALSTDIIVGFPGETEQDFQDTLSMVEECGFMSSYSFCYSDRPGARASLMPDKISDEVKLERLGRLQSLQERIGGEWLRGRVGKPVRVLLECPSPRNNEMGISWQGRDAHGAVVNIDIGSGDHSGEIVDARITSAKRHSLLGKLV